MSDVTEPTQEGPLIDLVKSIKKHQVKFEKSNKLALFVLGVEYDDTISDSPTINTFLTGTGIHSLLAEGLYGELREQIESGNKALFFLLTEVLQDIMEDLDLYPDPESDENIEPTFH